MYIASIVIATMGCKTIDVEKTMIQELKNEQKALQEKNTQLEKAVSTLLEVEKTEYYTDVEPIVIPYKEVLVVPESSQKTESKITAEQAVKKTMNDAMVTPENNIGGTQLFDYNENKQFPIFTQMLQQTVIILGEGEIPIVDPFMSDTIRWEVDGDVWNNRQLVILKPLESGLKTNMLIATNKRIYNFILTSTTNMYMPMVKFRYPLERENILSNVQRVKQEESYEYEKIDPSLISANYKISQSFFFPPLWSPKTVYDDGHKTYIVFPESVLQRELPVVYEGKNDIINYRVNENMIIMDKLIKKCTLKINKEKITIEKKKGSAEKLPE